MPKSPQELREQIERENAASQSEPGNERSAEGKEVRTPSRDEFFKNLGKVGEPEKK